MTVDILLATFNSEKFLQEQVDSLLNQTFQDWKLLIRDGGSTDSTHLILEKYLMKFPKKISLIPTNTPSTCTENFSELMKASNADIIFFCDHDDFWLPEKLEKCVTKMKEMEREYGTTCPLALHHDMQMCNESLEIQHFSRIRMQKMSPTPRPNVVIVEANIYGCAMAINQSLAKLCKSIPPDVAHDYYLATLAVLCGHLEYVGETLIKYRRHDHNVSGFAKHTYSKIGLLRYLMNIRKVKADRYSTYVKQAQIMIKNHFQDIPKKHRNMLETFSQFEQLNLLVRKYYMLKYCIHMTGVIRSLGLFLII